MNFEQIQELKRLNSIKDRRKSIICEIVIPDGLKEKPASVLYGSCGDVEMGVMVQYLEYMIESIKQNFPEVEQILPTLKRHSSVIEGYKEIELMRGD